MQRMTLVLAALVLAGVARGSARATEGTCTITKLTSANNLNLPFRVPIANGVVMPVEFDEAAGTFAMKRDTWSGKFGPQGAAFDTGFGPQGFVIMTPGTVTGTLDRQGNVILPRFAMAFATNFCLPRSPDYDILPDLSTEVQFRVADTVFTLKDGVPLDFATGTLTLEGLDVIPSACGAPGPILSGLLLTCVLDPIPDQTKLPSAPSLARLAGKAQIGPPLPSAPPTKPDKGDVLVLRVRLADWRTPIDFSGDDVFLRLTGPSGDLVVFRVPAGKLQTRGKRLLVQDKDGTAIEVFKGHKESESVSAAFGGNVAVVSSSKHTDVRVRVLGLDLGGLSGSGTVTVAVGPRSATANVTVQGSGKSRKLH